MITPQNFGVLCSPRDRIVALPYAKNFREFDVTIAEIMCYVNGLGVRVRLVRLKGTMCTFKGAEFVNKSTG